MGVLGEVLCDQKFMALFSALFGAGIVLFADRAAARGARPTALSLWRNTLLLGFGLVHASFWDGDILLVYALCAPVLILLRRARPSLLAGIGFSLTLLPVLLAGPVQDRVDAGAPLGEYWGAGEGLEGVVGLWLLSDFFARALGMMLVGVAAYRRGFLQGAWSDRAYRRTAAWGLGLGLPLAAFGQAWLALADYGTDIAVAGTVPNKLATPLVAAGYAAAVILWLRRNPDSGLLRRIRAAGRMALTNYLSQTALGLVTLRVLLADVPLGRASLLVFVVAVWALQLWWSPRWLARHRFGPLEWLWRAGTYRRRP